VQRAISDGQYEEMLADPSFYNFDNGLRALRNAIYGKPTSDGNWESCRLYWSQAANHSWLIAQVKQSALKGR